MFQAILLTWALGYGGGYEWRSFNDSTDDYALLFDGHQVGAYNAAKDSYRPYDRHTDKWGTACKPPIDPPIKNFGVNLSATKPGTHYSVNGKEVSQEEADLRIASKVSLLGDPADTRKRVVVIGSDEATKPVLSGFKSNPELNALDKVYVVSAWRPDDWQVARSGFVIDGMPTIYLMQHDGKVLYRRDDFECGPTGLAEALRDADPDYKPESDPGPAMPLADFNNPTTLLSLGACLAFVVALALFVWGVRKWRTS